MYKLHKLGVKGKIWSIINDCHIDTRSAVVVNQTQSDWFPVLQGVRQGGVLSSFLYLVFIDDLLVELETTYKNTGISSVTSCCPTLADDLCCIATAPYPLQSMLNIASIYSKRWHFEFNANKSCILKFRAIGRKIDNDCKWYLDDVELPITQSHNHLGITVCSNCKLSERISIACEKGRKAYFGLSDIGSPYLNPLTISHLYKSVILSSVLYGCELWNDMTSLDTRKLTTFQHFVCKNALKLPRHCRSDICESLLNLVTVLAEIEVRKLLFFGRLCRLHSDTLPKKIFLYRMFEYMEADEHKQRGFIPDALRLLSFYGLYEHLTVWISDGDFPSKLSWKQIVRSTVRNHHIESRIDRIESDSTFYRFKEIFSTREPCTFWSIPKNCFEIALCKFICKLFAESNTQPADHICSNMF
ncbi:hypothetical protein FSP39_000985 [Pinctada imbricata]|uniref:Reverse transcriptase domain-containing protein n=1 Tax=Pinctada imbricata TaxID=66713 RepID=A0AA88Y2R3_PINIB|nr:hypothetical protein FSP39_000985 [Pinctada imbricata]